MKAGHLLNTENYCLLNNFFATNCTNFHEFIFSYSLTINTQKSSAKDDFCFLREKLVKIFAIRGKLFSNQTF